MKRQDARSLPPAAQEALRRRVVAAVGQGMSKAQAARVFGVSRFAVHLWCERAESGGEEALRARRRGRPPRPQLAPKKVEKAVRLILTRCPDQLRLPYALWTREAVGRLLAERFGLRVSVWTVGRYLRRWGLTPQKPLRRAYEQDPEAVRRWLNEEYPAIREWARRHGAEIHWGDEMGLRSDHQAGRTWGLRGQTPVVEATGRRFRCNVISTLTNRGRLAFMVFTERFTGPVFVRFLTRLLRHVPRHRKICLIVDGHPVHRSALVRRWLREHDDRIRMFLLPAYSPELNPDEYLNQDVKTNALGRQRPPNLPMMHVLLHSYLRRTQRRPELVRRYFLHPNVRYAASPTTSTV